MSPSLRGDDLVIQEFAGLREALSPRVVVALCACAGIAALVLLPAEGEEREPVLDPLERTSAWLRVASAGPEEPSGASEGSRLLAECGASQGFAVRPRLVGWEVDHFRSGRFWFLVGPDGGPNVRFRDATGSTIRDAREEGAEVVLRGPASQPTFIVTYRRGDVEAYSITRGEGSPVLHWTQHVANAPLTGPKSGAYVAPCRWP